MSENNILNQGFIQAPAVKILINIGALLDIPTGYYIVGPRGESVLNGGLGTTTGVVGIGNNFKSTIMHYMGLSAMARILAMVESSMSTYDTEVNIHESRLKMLYRRLLDELGMTNRELLEDGSWVITDKTIYYGNEWFEILKEFLKNKKTNAAKITVDSPFPGRDGKTLMKMMVPTFSEIDSLSEFATSDVVKIQDENELGESGGNTMHMRSGLAKTRLLMELPALVGGANHFMLMTAQVGKGIQMASGPMPAPPTKKLQYLKNGDEIKGVTGKFFFLMSNCWHAFNAVPLINQGTKGAEYPRDSDDNQHLDTDLNIVSLRQLRGKAGPTGNTIELIVSQIEGVLPSLTEFHYIKDSERYGLSGTLQHYALDLLPDVKLSRTTVRSKLDNDPKLRRAMNITAEMCQIKEYYRSLDESLICTPKELYEDLIKLGYDWNDLLSGRGWWTVNNYDHPVPFLSTMDLLKMRIGRYHPYWMTDEKKPKPEYRRRD